MGHLRLVDDAVAEATPDDALPPAIRAVRRDMARLLRALQASGRGIASWPDEVVTRLAHVDAVTARYLIDPTQSDRESVRAAAVAMRALEGWVTGRLTKRELASVRAFELMIRITDAQLESPLLRPDGAPEEESPSIAIGGSVLPRSLRAGLSGLDDEGLSAVCRRLGVRPLELEGAPQPAIDRRRMQHAVTRTLRDDHLLSILVATLSRETQELLASLVRGLLAEHAHRNLATEPALVTAAGGTALAVTPPAAHLRSCGLAFRSGPTGQERLWVPVELQHRLDGVLRAFGI